VVLIGRPKRVSTEIERIIGNVRIIIGDRIQFDHITIVSPEGKLLVDGKNLRKSEN
jgi:hypothetical protein